MCEACPTWELVGELRTLAHSIEGGLKVEAQGLDVGHDDTESAAALVLTRGEEVMRLVAIERVTALIDILRPLGSFPMPVTGIDVEVLLLARETAGRGVGVVGDAGVVAIVARGSRGTGRLCLEVTEAAEDGLGEVLLAGAFCVGPLCKEREGGEDLLLGATRC